MSEIRERISADLKSAIKAKEEVKIRTIRMIKAEIMNYETSGKDKVVDEEAFIKLLRTLKKQREDSIEQYRKVERDDLAEKEVEEVKVIEEYLPKALSKEELESIIKKVIEETEAKSMKDMGKVMKKANAEIAGRADGKTISTIVRTLLSS